MPRRDTRNEIIDAAIAILGSEGPDGFSAAALARRVGISKATLFHHFPTVDDIPLAAFERMITELMSQAPSGDADMQDTLAGLGSATFGMVDARRDFLAAWFVFFGKALFDDRLKARLRQEGDDLIGGMRMLFAPHANNSGEADAMARLVAMTLDGMALHLLALDDRSGIEAAWNLFRRLAGAGTTQSDKEDRQ